MCGDGSRPIDPPSEPGCPKQMTIIIKDILHSGNQDLWDNEIQNGDVFELEPEAKDHNVMVLYEGQVIGWIFDVRIHKCLLEEKYEYEAILINKRTKTVRIKRGKRNG